MTCVLAAIWKSGHVQHDIDFSEAKWKQDDTKYKDQQLSQVYTNTKFTRFRAHWIKELSRISKGDDKGTTGSADSAVTSNLYAEFYVFKA